MGIEDNNGWNVINWNQDSSDYIEDTLPEAEDTVLWIRALVGPGEAPVVASMIDSDFEGENYFTHWKPLEDKFPIY